MTRFEALRLGPSEAYEKIILLDADILPFGGYDALFSLPTPAGIIMERKDECYSGASEISHKWNWCSMYEPGCPHGAAIPKTITGRVRHDTFNMGVHAGLWVLLPSWVNTTPITSFLHTLEPKPWSRLFLGPKCILPH